MTLKQYLLFIGILTFSTSIFGQASISMWKNAHAHEGNGPHVFHNTGDNEMHKELNCGYSSYITFSEGTQTAEYSICNAGDASLEITLPLEVTGSGDIDQLSIQQPTHSSIAPSTCIDFSVTYTAPAEYADLEGRITINSNDATNPSCILNYDIGLQEGPRCPPPTIVELMSTPTAVVVNSTCTTVGGTPEGGSISAPVSTDLTTDIDISSLDIATVDGGDMLTFDLQSNGCPVGFTLEYAIDNEWPVWSTEIPAYDPTTAITVMTRCTCEESFNEWETDPVGIGAFVGIGDEVLEVIGSLVTTTPASVTTEPGTCPTCPAELSTFTAPAAVVVNSTCTIIGGTPTGGSISAPTTPCPTDSDLEYSIDDGATWSSVVPAYTTEEMTILTRCYCAGGADAAVVTVDIAVPFRATTGISSVTGTAVTVPGTCPTVAPLTVDDLSVSDPCSCDNPNNIVSTTGLGLVELFHDVLEVNTTAGVVVSLSATDNNLLDATGSPISVGTAIPETAPGIYQLIFYTVPDVAANVTVSNGVSTEDFITASCSPCPSTIPTMSQWGLMIFGLLILNMSVVMIRREETILG